MPAPASQLLDDTCCIIYEVVFLKRKLRVTFGRTVWDKVYFDFFVQDPRRCRRPRRTSPSRPQGFSHVRQPTLQRSALPTCV